ncbi:uncharacterized protein C19orf44 homolog isoform X2 [Pseudophryne corroboree]|uniref:uncharacterized protein C19orf44 homolog isoform X2 n=1 Tax=Pseudophryne corroboree TaxID=495146 RepID=UPI003081CAEE
MYVSRMQPSPPRQNMLARNGMRSSALARAQAHLSGQRVPIKQKDTADELQEYMHTLNKKTSALRHSEQSFADLSDLSVDEHEGEKYKATSGPQQTSETKSRFLKKKSPSGEHLKGNAASANEMTKHAHPHPVQSKLPTSAALKRLAEFENRHRLRKLEMDISENDSDLRTSEERPFSNRSSSDFSVRENRFLKKKVYIKEPVPRKQEQDTRHAVRSKPESKRGTMESEEEEMLHLVGSSLEMSENGDRWWKKPEPPRTPSPPSKSTPRRKLRHSPSALGFFSPRRPPSRLPSRTPSPPSHGTPRFHRRTLSLTRFGSRSPSPSVRSSLSSPSPRLRLGRRSRTSMSQRSDLKSLDELFSRAEDMSSASSNDFKLNILSLDELALPADTEDLEEKTSNHKAMTVNQLSATRGHELSHKKGNRLPKKPSSTSEEDSASEIQSETNKDSDSSEHHHEDRSSSSESYFQERPVETDIQSAYSEDFEDSVLSETEQSSKSSSYSKSLSSKEYSFPSSHSSTHPTKPRESKKWAGKGQSVAVKEIAVQTSDSGFMYHWPQEHTTNPIVMEPVSMVSHVVSHELIEALTTYSPMALALNDMLKQQLLLTQTFADMARQFHFSTVQSLESDLYNYTTLEETKKYITQQKFLKWNPGLRGEESRLHSLPAA